MKTEIFKALTNEWQATATLVRLTNYRYNFYEVLDSLVKANEAGLVERYIKGRRQQINKWRLPQEKTQGELNGAVIAPDASQSQS